MINKSIYTYLNKLKTLLRENRNYVIVAIPFVLIIIFGIFLLLLPKSNTTTNTTSSGSSGGRRLFGYVDIVIVLTP